MHQLNHLVEVAGLKKTRTKTLYCCILYFTIDSIDKPPYP